MEIKVVDAIASIEALAEITNVPTVKASYLIGQNITKLKEVQATYAKGRDSRLEKMGTPNPDKVGVFDLNDNAGKFLEAEKTALEEEIPVDLNQVTLAELEGASIDPKVFAVVEWMIKD